MSDLPPVLFGGPDRPPGALRAMLEALVEATPTGGRIDWATYYFRDMGLADALTRASDRGVAVRLVLEGRPRVPHANHAVIARLRAHGLGGGLHLRRRLFGLGQLHTKIYAFDDLALVGSFNPSGTGPPDDPVIREIGDQDRGWNLLLPVRDPAAVARLRAHATLLSRTAATPLDRLRPVRTLASDPRLLFYPRLVTTPVEREIAALGHGDALDAAVSHMKPGPFAAALARAAAAGARVRLLVHATERRVPGALVDRLAAAGAEIARAGDAAVVPMHNKFVLVTRAGRRHAWVGSYNYNAKSRWLNDELLVRTAEPTVVAALAERFETMRG